MSCHHRDTSSFFRGLFITVVPASDQAVIDDNNCRDRNADSYVWDFDLDVSPQSVLVME